jgi:hypothetical protein
VGGPQMYGIFGVMMLVTLILYVLFEKQLPKIQHAEV